jgi:hypothetical protein
MSDKQAPAPCPINKLHAKLLEVADDAAANDRILSQAYKSLEGTDGYEAIECLFHQVREQVRAAILAASCPDRGFYAGQLAIIELLQNQFNFAFDFDPETAEYDPPEEPAASDDILQMPPGVDY